MRHKRETHPAIKKGVWFLVACLVLELLVGCTLLLQPREGWYW